MASQNVDYNKWTKESLVKRVKYLEYELAAHKQPAPPDGKNGAVLPVASNSQSDLELAPTSAKKKAKKDKKIDPSRYSTRFIALKLAYLGKNYNGFEHQSSAQVPTIEEELWKALVKSCLIWPEKPDEVDFGPWEYSKCGRTDRGVSAFGQVIGIRVRSNKPVPREPNPTEENRGGKDADVAEAGQESARADAPQAKKAGPEATKPAWDPIADEISYCRVLNRILPPDIRVLAWCPNPPPEFSARFSCRERQYRYFFTQPAFAPLPSSMETGRRPTSGKEGWLDIDAMRQAAKMFEGLHDFRNVCKIDAGRQITNFKRRVFESDIVEVKDVASAIPFLDRTEFRPDATAAGSYPQVYYFHVRGSAFLWHQIRHMIALLFAVGQGLESPSLVRDLLDVEKNPRKPNYNMADEVPLVLWDCIFPDLDGLAGKDPHGDGPVDTQMQDTIDWVWLGEDTPLNMHGSIGLVDHLWEHWRGKKMDELLANRLLDWASSKANLDRRLAMNILKQNSSQRIFEGSNGAKFVGTYVPIMQKPQMPSPQEANDKWAQSKGFANAEELTREKNWRSALKAKRDGVIAKEAVGDADE